MCERVLHFSNCIQFQFGVSCSLALSSCGRCVWMVGEKLLFSPWKCIPPKDMQLSRLCIKGHPTTHVAVEPIRLCCCYFMKSVMNDTETPRGGRGLPPLQKKRKTEWNSSNNKQKLLHLLKTKLKGALGQCWPIVIKKDALLLCVCVCVCEQQPGRGGGADDNENIRT